MNTMGLVTHLFCNFSPLVISFRSIQNTYQRFVSNDLFFVQRILSYIYISCSSKPISGCFIWVLASPFRNGRFSLVVFLLYPLSSLSFRWAYLSVYCNETIQAFAHVPSIFEFINPYSIQIFNLGNIFEVNITEIILSKRYVCE